MCRNEYECIFCLQGDVLSLKFVIFALICDVTLRCDVIRDNHFNKLYSRTMKKIMLSLVAGLCALATPAIAQDKVPAGEKIYKYRLYLKDKKNSPYKINKPEEFLSAKAIERRRNNGVKVDQYDLPISPAYLQELRSKGAEVVNVSKWNNTVVVASRNEALLKGLTSLNFVDSVLRVYATPDSIAPLFTQNRFDIAQTITNDKRNNYYGAAYGQNVMLGAEEMHQKGYRGEGVTIAIIDGGFYNADLINGLRHAYGNVLSTKNFVRPDTTVYNEDPHGMNVLACIAGYEPEALVGIAPNAKFHLLVSEQSETEFMIEEDNYCSALEYADSVGADIVTVSLGYTKFDDSPKFAKYHELTGNTHINSRSASLAHSRGIILVNSGGNSATDTYKLIGFPADATNILAVGAVRADSINTNFSSIGFTTDGRIKPDVTAQGQRCASYGTDGKLIFINGTSFSGPLTAGAVALLRQQFPKASAKAIMDAVRQSGHKATTPDNIYGYGIPNMPRAAEILKRAGHK